MLIKLNKKPLPKVLVILATKNGQKFLSKQIESILNQENVNITLLCGDDDSKDSTVSILNDLCRGKLAGEIINLGGIGALSAFVRLTEMASLDFDFYAFSDQDDMYQRSKSEFSYDCNIRKKIY